jgi:GT2 family glycosyltransferase
MRVGIGITTYNRPHNIEECLNNIYEFTDLSNTIIYIATDTDEDRRGIAYRKNECLRALKDCDYIFLLDDDCFPIKHGWTDFFIKKNDKALTRHFLYLNNSHGKTNQHYNSAFVYNNCGGVFMFLDKETLLKVGAFNENYGIYGFEHAEYSNRISLAGFNWMPYLCLKDTDKYLFAHDYSTPNHKSSISDSEKKKHIKNNWNKFFNEPIKNIYLPL